MTRRPITVYAGTRFTLGLRLPDPSGTPLAVVGLLFALYTRSTQPGEPLLEQQLDYDPETGIHSVDLDPDTTTTLAPDWYAYRITLPTGEPLLGGPLTVRSTADD